jgi:hypothetical protein
VDLTGLGSGSLAVSVNTITNLGFHKTGEYVGPNVQLITFYEIFFTMNLFNLFNSSDFICTTSFNIPKLCILLTERIYVFHTILTINRY